MITPSSTAAGRPPVREQTQDARRASRLFSLDAYRGLIMISLAFGGFGLAATARGMLEENPNDSFWMQIQQQFSHAQWVGWGYWDMIQPSFMFMVGVSMAYSYAKRAARGDSYLRMLGHAATRSLVLILLGVFLSSSWSSSTNWSFMNVLSQIGLGYLFLFLVLDRGWIAQMAVAAAVLGGTWAMYTYHDAPTIDLTTGDDSVGVSAEWAQKELALVGPAWQKNANVGQAIDVVVLNWFPRETPFEYNKGGYQTINFLPSLATMIFGLLCGELLRSEFSSWSKLSLLIIGGGVGVAAGYALDFYDLCPLVKRIWTPSWALFSSGICCWILAAFYLLFDVVKLRFLAYPLVVVGVNSLVMYFMGQLLRPWATKTLQTHFGGPSERAFGTGLFDLFGPAYEPMTHSIMVGLFFWLICLWMYRQKLFVRI